MPPPSKPKAIFAGKPRVKSVFAGKPRIKSQAAAPAPKPRTKKIGLDVKSRGKSPLNLGALKKKGPQKMALRGNKGIHKLAAAVTRARKSPPPKKAQQAAAPAPARRTGQHSGYAGSVAGRLRAAGVRPRIGGYAGSVAGRLRGVSKPAAVASKPRAATTQRKHVRGNIVTSRTVNATPGRTGQPVERNWQREPPPVRKRPSMGLSISEARRRAVVSEFLSSAGVR